jgi:hypothetical protein
VDIVRVLKTKIASLPQGSQALGLLAVETHIRCGVRHLMRGQTEADETAFTDAIYRCNQAFEGSIKEAYRVLAGKEPSKKTTAQIEDFLTDNQILRQRVLDQFTIYRQQWRNPSTHDYTLDFDESEALLAIVSVTAFAIVLCDQIQTAIVAKKAAEDLADKPHVLAKNDTLQEQVTTLIEDFLQVYEEGSDVVLRDAGRTLEGALAGYLSAAFGTDTGVKVEIGRRFDGREADVAVTRGEEQIAVEVKRFSKPVPSRLFSSLSYLDSLMNRGITDGVILAFNPDDKKAITARFGLNNGKIVNAVMSETLFKVSREFFPNESSISFVSFPTEK